MEKKKSFTVELDHPPLRWRWVVEATPRPLYPQGKGPDIHCIGGWVAPGPVRTGTENLVPTGFDPRIFQPVASRYTD